MNKKTPSWFIMLVAVFLFTAMGSIAEAAPILVSPSPASFGEIERITLDNPVDVYSGGVMVVGGVEMILPKNLLIDLPANRLSLQQIFAQAPADCVARGESGLAKADKCNGSGSGGIATLSAVRSNAGNVIVGDLFIQKAAEVVQGRVTYINYDQGYYRVNGIDNNPNTGAIVRLNDPTSRHTIQNGAGCAGGPNCSPDPRFTLDPDNYTNTFATGYPVCIPSTVSRSFTNPLDGPASSQATANGTGDYLCPNTNRTPGVINEPAVADSRRFAPVMVGDSVLAEGNFETINGVRFLSAHTTTIQKALATSTAPGQPDYLFLEEVGTEAPPFQNQRLVNLFIGFTTLAPTDVDIWSIHRDPVNNEVHEFPYASVTGCDNASGGAGECSAQGLANAGANIFKINYKVDFNKTPDPRLSPCAHLRASRFATSHPGLCSGGVTHASDFAVMSPSPHEIIARTGRKITSAAGSLITIDINGNPATNGEYLFPLGLNLGGLGVAEMSEIDINVLDTPIPFEGIPWNLDRRLGPAGCLNGGCESLTTSPIGTFALDPFPYSGLDPRLQSPGLPSGSYSDPVFNTTGNPLTNIRNRMFSYVDSASGKFNGNATVLPYALGTFPRDPPLITINPTPALNIFPPIADEDNAVVISGPGASVNINVIANDIPIIGDIDPASLQIASDPANGTVQLNPNHTITYFPANPYAASTATFTYTVANNFGSVSQPGTVTVTIINPPVAVNDSISIPALSTMPIDLVGNDIAGSNGFNLASASLTGPPSCGTAVNQLNGTVNFTAPATTGSCTFSYTVNDTTTPAIVSNTATVNVTVTPAQIVVANDDASITTTGGSVNINVISNDTSATGTINPASLVVAVPTGGSAAANPDGTVTYRAPALPGTYTFTYTVKDNVPGSLTSNPATVSVIVELAPQVSGLTVFSSLPSPQLSGTVVTFDAVASGGSGSYEYQYWLKDTSLNYTLVKPYSAPSTWSWETAGLPTAGGYQIAVQARNAGSTVSFDQERVMNFSLNAPSGAGIAVNVLPNVPSPQTAGTPVFFAATVTGGTGIYEYQYWLKDTLGNYSLVQPYSLNSTWKWDTTGAAPGGYTVALQARVVGSQASFDAETTADYLVNAVPTPATSVSVTTSLPSPQTAGPQVFFSAAAAGGSGSYEYRFWLKDILGSYSLVQPFSSGAIWKWNTTGLPAGTYTVAVQARSAGSPNVYDTEATSTFVISAPPAPPAPATAVNILTNLTSPQTAGAQVFVTGSAVGGPGNYEYLFKLTDPLTNTTVVQAFSAGAIWHWDTTGLTPGTYTITVQARSVGSVNVFDVENTLNFDL